MKIIKKWMLMAVAPVLLVAPVLGQEKDVVKSEKTVEVKKPTLTYYYFDG